MFLAIILSACTFQVDVVTPSASSTVPPATSPALTLPADTPSPFPTPTFIPAIPPSPLQENAGVYPIQFAPNGTYMDVVDSLLAGSSKTYSINAAKGQVMSISIRLGPYSSWTVIPMKIAGADGTVLCPVEENLSCYFWRGALPATQDYFVTLTPEIDVSNFTMRVAIDPPGTTSQSFQYLSNNRAASFSYPDEFSPVLLPDMYTFKLVPEMALQFIDTNSLDNTNLIEAYFLFGASNDAGIVESCTQPVSLGGQETIIDEVDIGGVPFTRSEAAGLGAGNIYEQIYHRAVYHGYCYEVTFFIHSANIGNYAAESGVREFDYDALMQKFESILSTFVIK